MSTVTNNEPDDAVVRVVRVALDSQDTSHLDIVERVSLDLFRHASLMRIFENASHATGGYVRLIPELGLIPTLMGSDDEPVFLYHLIEGFDEFLDYDALLAEYPTLNFSQVLGAVKFLRKLSQTNVRRVDIDAAEEEFDLQNNEFLRQLIHAYENRGNVSRVLPEPV